MFFLSGSFRFSGIKCSNSNGKVPNSTDDDEEEKKKKIRAELSARIASGEFTVEKSGYDHISHFFRVIDGMLIF